MNSASPPLTDTDYATLAESRRRKWIRFDPQINTGHILQIIVIVAGFFTAYATLDKRTTLAEQAQTQLDRRLVEVDTRINDQSVRAREALAEIKADLREMRMGMAELGRVMRKVE